MDSILVFQTGFTGLTGFFSPSARSPFGRRPFYPDDPVDPVQFSFKDENPFLFLPYFDLRFFTFLFRSDYTLMDRGVARVKLHKNGTVF